MRLLHYLNSVLSCLYLAIGVTLLGLVFWNGTVRAPRDVSGGAVICYVKGTPPCVIPTHTGCAQTLCKPKFFGGYYCPDGNYDVVKDNVNRTNCAEAKAGDQVCNTNADINNGIGKCYHNVACDPNSACVDDGVGDHYCSSGTKNIYDDTFFIPKFGNVACP